MLPCKWKIFVFETNELFTFPSLLMSYYYAEATALRGSAYSHFVAIVIQFVHLSRDLWKCYELVEARRVV